jgi:hypothetical protein
LELRDEVEAGNAQSPDAGMAARGSPVPKPAI